MNLVRLLLSAVAAFVAYMVVGGLGFVLIPSLKTEFAKYSAVYRDHDGQMSHMPAGMAGIFIAILALAFLYSSIGVEGSGLVAGVRFGAVIGVFVLGAFVLHNYANLNIGLTLAIQQCVAYFVEWLVVGIVIGLIYRPAVPH